MKLHNNLVVKNVFNVCNTGCYTFNDALKLRCIIYILSCNIII